MKHKISKKNDVLYSELFGRDMKGKNVEIGNDGVDINELNQPFVLKLSNQVFKIIDTIFTTVVPYCMVLILLFLNIDNIEICNRFNMFKFIFSSNFFISLLMIIGYIFVVKSVIWLINLLVNFVIVFIYSIILNSLVKRTEKTSAMISKKLAEQDAKDKENEEREKYNGYTEKEIVDHAKELIKKRQEENNNKS